MIRVLLADDHEVIRFGLGVLIGAVEDLELVGAAADGLAAVAMAMRDGPDVVVMDLSMPLLDGITATREIVRARPMMRVLVLTSYFNRPIVRAARDAGASGYLLKDDRAETVIDAIRAVHFGERRWPRRLRSSQMFDSDLRGLSGATGPVGRHRPDQAWGRETNASKEVNS